MKDNLCYETCSISNRINLKNQSSLFTALFLSLVVLLIFSPDLAFAGTGGTELKAVYDKVVGFAEGWGGKLIAALSFIVSGIGAVRGNLLTFGSALGTGIALAVGPSMVTGGISGLI